MPHNVGSGITGRVNLPGSGPLPGNLNPVVNGLKWPPLRERSRLFTPRARGIIAAAVEKAMADAIAASPSGDDPSPYATAKRAYARTWAMRRVMRCLDMVDLEHPLARDELAEVTFVLAPIWMRANASPFSMLYPVAESGLGRVRVTRAVRVVAARPVHRSGG